MRSRIAARPASTKTVVIIIAAVAAVGFVLLAICCGVGIWLFRDTMKDAPVAQAAADAFFADLQSNRVANAYSNTTADFRSNTSQAQLEGLLVTYPALKNHTSRSYQLGQMYQGTGGQQATFTVTFQAPTGTTNCTVILMKEASGWKMHRLNLPLPPAPGR